MKKLLGQIVLGLGLLAGCGLLMSGGAQAGAFADACLANGGGTASAQNCACQEKLAESTLDPQEMTTIIASASGRKADYVAALNAMSEDQAQKFREKLQQLGDAVDAKCAQQ